MRNRMIVVFAAMAATLAVMSPALAQMDRFEVPIVGDYFECGDATYTVVEGSIAVAVGERESGSGNTMLNVAIRPRATLVDGDGAEYELVGAESVHVSTTAGGHVVVQEVFHVNIVAPGVGVVGRAATVAHLTIGANGVVAFEFDTGTCVGPLG